MIKWTGKWTGKSTDGSWNRVVEADTMFDLYVKLLEENIVMPEEVEKYLLLSNKYGDSLAVLVGSIVELVYHYANDDMAERLSEFYHKEIDSIVANMPDDELQSLIEYNDGQAYYQTFDKEM